MRSNSILENYNKHLKESLGKKKEINYINFLSFIKKEEEKIFKEFNLKSRNYGEILKYRNIHKYNIEDEDIQLDDSNYIPDTDIIIEEMNTNEEHISKGINKGRWLKWTNNSCRFDAIMTLYLFLFYDENEINKEGINNEGMKILHESISTILENPFSEDRYNFWSYANLKQLDRGEHPLNFGEIGFISGIFTIFNDNLQYCIKLKKTFICFSCMRKAESTYNNNSLISIRTDDLKNNSLSQIVNNKFLPSISTCECSVHNGLMTSNITYEILNYPKYLFFIIDIDYRDYFKFVDYLSNLFADNININGNGYNVKGLICMPSELHYTCYIINNDKNFLGLSLNKTLYHDGKQNNGFIVECDDTVKEIIKKCVSYIIILIKS